jgi:G3E family GTPase
MNPTADLQASPIPGLVFPRPLVLITGFLGAGKTTFLTRLLNELRHHMLTGDVILNDYENASLDAERLREQAASIEPIAAACACCDGMEALVDLALAASRADGADCLLIELNGTADPLPLLESFTLLESMLRFHPRWQVCVLDARQTGQRGYYQRLEDLQLQTASHFMLSHDEDLNAEMRSQLMSHVRRINPYATQIRAKSLADAMANVMARKRPRLMRPQTSISAALPSPIRGHHLAHEFTGCQVALPEKVSREAMWRFLAALPPSVLRAKALASVIGEEGKRRLFERVGMELIADPLEVNFSSKVGASAVLIGPDLNPAELEEIARQELGEFFPAEHAG